MSDDLADEVEAINSIYGDGTLTPADDTSSPSSTAYILNLPGDASSLRLSFPSAYPAQAPAVLGTHHSSGGVRGAGARDLALFRDVLRETFREGEVCLFDAVEEFGRRWEDEVNVEQEVEEEEEYGEEGVNTSVREEQEIEDLPTPPWTISLPVIDCKSTFIAHVAPVTSPSQARLYVQALLSSDRRFRSATHNMTAWRIRGAGSTSYQDCDDDGETAAGSRLLHLMQLMEIWDAMVVVSRWYGGVKLGPRRFAVINGVARDGFVRAGMVEEKKDEKKKR